MPTATEIYEQMMAMHPLPRQRWQKVACSKCQGTGHIATTFPQQNWRCSVCYGSGWVSGEIPYTPEEQVIWDAYEVLRKTFSVLRDAEAAALIAAREAQPSFRRFQVEARNDEDGESLWVTVEVWLDENGVIRYWEQEDDYREDADHES